MFCILKSNITNLKAHVKFIGLFRHKTCINSEEDYFLSLVFQSIEYIERMNSSHLKIGKNEFNELCDEFEKKELIRNNKTLKSNIIYVIFLAVDDQSLVFMLNKSSLVEEEDITHSHDNDFMNFTLIKSHGPILENINDGILNLDTEKLFNEYCSNSFGENSLGKYENMYNDFKIILKIAESLKSEYKNIDNQTAGIKTFYKDKEVTPKTSSTSSNLIDF